MKVTSMHELDALKAITRTPTETVEAYCALLDVQREALATAKNADLPAGKRRAAYWLWAALQFVDENPEIMTLEFLGVPEGDEEDQPTGFLANVDVTPLTEKEIAEAESARGMIRDNRRETKK